MSKGQVLTEALAIDCEMVEASGGRNTVPNGFVNMVARVSLVNEDGKCVYDTYVKPTKPVTDYRTAISGVTKHHLDRHGRDFNLVKSEVADMIRGRWLVGHSIDKDLRVLGLCHPEFKKRDTATYPPFQTNKGTPSLKYLASRYLGWNIQDGSHSSVQDARAAMMLYKREEAEWEDYSDSSDEEEGIESDDALLKVIENLRELTISMQAYVQTLNSSAGRPKKGALTATTTSKPRLQLTWK